MLQILAIVTTFKAGIRIEINIIYVKKDTLKEITVKLFHHQTDYVIPLEVLFAE